MKQIFPHFPTRRWVTLFGSVVLALAAPRASAITITQLNIEVNAKPGETIEKQLELYDETLTGVTVYPAVYNFTQDADAEGAATLITDPAEFTPSREWLKFDVDEITLPADGTNTSFSYRLELPPDAEPGTHLIALAFGTQPPTPEGEGATVSIGTIVVSNIFLKVAGQTIDDVSVTFQVGAFADRDPETPFSLRKSSFTPKTFFTKPPVDFLVTVKNEGNTHQKPGGNVRVQNDLLGRAFEKLPVNSSSRIILPGTERSFEVDSFGDGFMFGKYRAKLTLIFGDPLRDVTEEVSFWIVPVVELATGLGALLVIAGVSVLLGVRRQRRLRREEVERERRIREQVRKELEASRPPKPRRRRTRRPGKRS